MSAYVQVDSRIMRACENFWSRDISLTKFSWITREAAGEICSLEDKDLSDTLYNIEATFDIEWYANFMDIKEIQAFKCKMMIWFLPYMA